MLSPTFPEVRMPHLADVPIPLTPRVRLTHPKGELVVNIGAAVDEVRLRGHAGSPTCGRARVAVAVAAAASRTSRGRAAAVAN